MSTELEHISCTANVERVSGTFTFRIGGFPALKDGIGDTVESPEFDLCSRKWQLRIFPGGSLTSHSGYISYYLASKSTVQTRASYKLIVLHQGNGRNEVFASTGVRRFEARGENVDGWGRDKFMERSVLLNPRNGFCLNDTVIFRAEVTVYSTIPTTTFNHMAMFGRGTKTVIDDLAEAWRLSVDADSDDENDDDSSYVITNISNNPSATSTTSIVTTTSSVNHNSSTLDQTLIKSDSSRYIDHGYRNEQELELASFSHYDQQDVHNSNSCTGISTSTAMKLDDSAQENEMKHGDEQHQKHQHKHLPLQPEEKIENDHKYQLYYSTSSGSTILHEPSSAFKDVTFKVGVDGAIIKASKFILCARSCVFRGMLSSGMIESTSKFIVIDDIDEIAFRHLLYFIYTDRVFDNLEEYAAQVLIAATKYQVSGLIERCSEALCARLTAENVHEVVELSSNFGADILKEFCVAYVVENSKEVLQSGGIATLVPELRNELLEAIHNSEVYAHYNSTDNGYSKSKNGCCIL